MMVVLSVSMHQDQSRFHCKHHMMISAALCWVQTVLPWTEEKRIQFNRNRLDYVWHLCKYIQCAYIYNYVCECEFCSSLLLTCSPLSIAHLFCDPCPVLVQALYFLSSWHCRAVIFSQEMLIINYNQHGNIVECFRHHIGGF